MSVDFDCDPECGAPYVVEARYSYPVCTLPEGHDGDHTHGRGQYQWPQGDKVQAPSPSDISTLVELAALTTDRTPDEQAALERVAAWADARSGLTIHRETVE